jgi:FAD/FMN-containing dehydrogenase
VIDTALDTLRDKLVGRLVASSDPDYETARQLQSAEFDIVRPWAVAYCANDDDVATCVEFARHNGIPVTPRGGGHSSAGYSTSEGLVLDLSAGAGVRVGRRTVRVGAGTQGVDVLAGLHGRGVQVLSGTCATVGVGGFLMGGGHGPLARRFGLASDRLVSAEVVLADGSRVRAAEDEHPDLFWALRGGGGGNFGVVTRLEVLPARAPRLVVFDVHWDWADALEVLATWQSWVVGSPWELSARAWVASLGDTAPPQVLVHGSYAGSLAACDRQLDELVDAIGRRPVERTAEELSYTEGMMRIFGCAGRTLAQSHRVGHNPMATLPRDNCVRTANRFAAAPMGEHAVANALAAFESDRRAAQFRIFGTYAFGGRINELDRTATAYVHRDAVLSPFYSASVLWPADQEERAAAGEWVRRGFAAIDGSSTGESFQNFMDPNLPNWRQAYYAENYPRLRAIKRRYDPHALFRFPQGID